MAGHRPILPHDVDGKLRDLIQACWNSNPSFRPTAMEACRVLDGLRSFNTHYSGVLDLAMNPKKFLNSTRAILHHMMHFFCLDGQSGFKQISSVGNLFQLDGVKSSMTTCDMQGLPEYLRIDPSTIQIVRRIYGHEDDHVQMIEIKIEGCKYALKILKNFEGQEQDPSF